ncbi:MAG: nucleotidyltransferase family protein [Paucibacter sp.]|nr:nucleotidyltransferase family protein [Roseateles sp.]
MSLLKAIWLQPQACAQLDESAWDLLVRQARHANLLGRLHHHLRDAGAPVHERAQVHLLSAATMAERQHRSVRREAGILRDTLAALGLPLILLKGAAYVLSGLPAARGRVFADVDILVPRERLEDVESQLMLTGWVTDNLDAYDQRYYRRWMHELPAMIHMHRGTALDVHHTILPATARLKPSAAALLEAAIELPGLPGIRVLSPSDMVLHSACHLFHEGEADNLLRDLSDLDLLLRHFGAQPDFWELLLARARAQQLTRPLSLALRYASTELATPVPETLLRETGAHRREALNPLYRRLFEPQHESSAGRAARAARAALFVRGHWLRMPPWLLAYHVAHKAIFPPQQTRANGP